MAKFHYDVLGKKPREEKVGILVDDTDEESDVVRLTFREVPDTEFAVLEASFRGAVAGVGKLSQEISQLEAKIHEERTLGEAKPATLEAKKKLTKGYREALEELQSVRREIVGKTVIDHDPETFEIDHLPFEGDDVAPAAKASLLALGFSEEAISEGFRVGYIRLPFKASTWVYESSQGEKTLPGAHEDTVRQYERLRPKSELLNAICNAFFYWHRLELKPAELLKKEMRERRLKRTRQEEKIQILFKHNHIPESSLEALRGMPSRYFDLTAVLLMEKAQRQLKEAAPLPPQKG